MPTISILTYNILSQTLAELMTNEIKNGEKVYDMSYMNESNRWTKISTLIQNKITESKELLEINHLVFCLQEVTEDWVSKFALLFGKNNYSYINNQHGRSFNGNMGVLIAWPNVLTVVKSEFYVVGRHILINDDKSKLAASKANTAILLLLEHSESLNCPKFGVVTYHMPLEPKIPHVSMMHAKVLTKKINKFMQNNLWFCAGDFNITPDTRTYNYLSSVSNSVWDNFNTYPTTNHAYIKGFEFSGCLDYIFYSKNSVCSVECVDVQYTKLLNIAPNNTNPSDHIPIYAKFKIN